jgi:hypothetical protein
METITIYPKSKSQSTALKTIFDDMQIKFKSNSSTKKKNHKLANDLRDAMKEVQLHRQGKLKLKTAKELANEL